MLITQGPQTRQQGLCLCSSPPHAQLLFAERGSSETKLNLSSEAWLEPPLQHRLALFILSGQAWLHLFIGKEWTESSLMTSHISLSLVLLYLKPTTMASEKVHSSLCVPNPVYAQQKANKPTHKSQPLQLGRCRMEEPACQIQPLPRSWGRKATQNTNELEIGPCSGRTRGTSASSLAGTAAPAVAFSIWRKWHELQPLL